MKRIICIALVFFTISQSTTAQPFISGSLFHNDRISFKIHRDHDHYHYNSRARYMMLDIGFTILEDHNYRLGNDIDPLEQNIWKSKNWNFHLVKQRIGLLGNHINFIYGLTWEIHNLTMENPVTILPEEPQLSFSYNDAVSYKTNRLNVSYLTIPIEINLEGSPDREYKSIRASAGVFGGVRVGSHLKQKISGEGNQKFRDDFNLNKWRYGIIGRFGIGPLNIYGTFTISQLFEDDQDSGVTARPISVGISLLPF